MLLRPARPSLIGRPAGLVSAWSAPQAGAAPPVEEVVAIIGAKAKAHWNAHDAGRITIATGVSSWRDSINNIDLVQATAGLQPAYSATGWNSASPAVTFDGSDDRLDYTGIPASFPVVGTDDAEIWMLVDYLGDPAADTTTRYLFGYGGTGNGTFYSVRRSVVTGNNRIHAANGAIFTSGTPNVALGSRVAVRGVFDKIGAGADAISTFIDGVAASSQVTTATFSAGTTRVRLGNTSSLTTNPGHFRVKDVIVSSALDAGEATSLLAYLAGRV